MLQMAFDFFFSICFDSYGCPPHSSFLLLKFNLILLKFIFFFIFVFFASKKIDVFCVEFLCFLLQPIFLLFDSIDSISDRIQFCFCFSFRSRHGHRSISLQSKTIFLLRKTLGITKNADKNSIKSFRIELKKNEKIEIGKLIINSSIDR